MKLLTYILLILTISVSGLVLVGNVHAQTDGSLTINRNTEWTTAQSPINFNGTIQVTSNYTLTIDPGVTVNLGSYMLIVYGTLIAQGSANNQIVFSAIGNQTVLGTSTTPIIFTQTYSGGNLVVSSPSIIQNSILNGVNVNVNGALSPTIDSCVFNVGALYSSPITVNGGSPQISNNIINYNVQGAVGLATYCINVFGGTPQIINHQFEGYSSGSSISGIEVTSGSPVITGNTFAAQYGNNSNGIKVTSGTPQITNNQFEGGGYLIGVYDSSTSAFTISNNVFSGCIAGINAQVSTIITVQGNSFLKGTDGIDIFQGASITITGNLIDGNSRYGINGGGTITSNTISNNQIGIHNPSLGTISNNNIVCNAQNSMTATDVNIDAENNWWGITDAATINRTIYDSKVDPTLGTISFAPFLTQPSSSAPAIPSYTPETTPIPLTTPQPQLQPTVTPQPVLTPRPTPDKYSQTFAYQVGSMINLNLITTATAAALVLLWVVVILGFAAKRGISKYRAKK